MEGTADLLYRTLADTDEIRLLHLQPGATNEPLICQLVHSTLLDKPQYEALSYMWERKESPLQIELNSSIVEVRNNLWQALSHLRQPQTTRILWIDALYINQNNTSERNHQVSQMGRIYENAHSVVAWLGVDDESSRIAMKYILDFQPRTRELFLLQDLLPKSPIVIDSYIIDAISSVCSREYWTRLWIVQELVLAERINILCGSWVCDWYQFAIALNSARDNIVLQHYLGENPSLEMGLGFSIVDGSRAMSLVDWRQFRRLPKLQVLAELCKAFGSSKCEDRRDRVFGLRALALGCCRDAVPVDYTISLAEISWTLLFHNASKHSHGKWEVSPAQQVLQALGVTKQDLEDPTTFLRNKTLTEEAGGVDPAPNQCTPIDLLDIARWAEVKLGGLGESEAEVAV
jgi:hypothetical protein